MFLGGNWQIKELKDALSPEEFAKWGDRADSAVSRGPGADRHRRLDLGGLREGSGEAARRRQVHPRHRGAAQRRAHQRRRPGGCRCAAASIATTRHFARSRFHFSASMLGAGARAAGGADLQRDLARAADRDRLRHRGHAHARSGRGRRVPRSCRRRMRAGARAPSAATASIRWPGCRPCSRRLLGAVALATRSARGSADVARAGGASWSRSFCSIRCSSSCASRSRISARPGRPYRYTLHGFRVARRRSAVLRDDRRHAGVRRRVGRAATWARPAAGVAVRRRRAAAGGGLAGRARRRGERVGDSRAC